MPPRLGKRTMDAAIGAMGDDPMPDSRRGRGMDPMGEDEYSPDAAHKDAFLEMCRAIREGDDESAWAAWQECKELG